MVFAGLRPLALLVVGLGLAGCPRDHGAPAVAAPAVDPNFVEGRWTPDLLKGVPRQGGQVVVRITGEPASLNRLIDSDLWLTRMVKPGVYETLLRVDGDDQPAYPLRPALAVALPELSGDRLTYTFKLRSGVRFHNGDPFSAHDVISTFNKLMDPKLRGQSLRSTVEGLVSWKALDPTTVQFTFREPNSLALRQLATAIPIMPSSVLDGLTADQMNKGAAINRSPIGTGPWRFESWETGQRITFARNADYWDPARTPHLEHLVFRIVLDHQLAYQLMLRGDLDVVSNLQPDQWLQMPTEPGLAERYRRFLYFSNNYAFIAWNEKRPFFKDARVRRALAELFDQDRFDEAVLHGLERRSSCAFYSASPDCDADLKPVPYDPAHAATLLDQAGWTDHDGDGVRDREGVPFHFRLTYPGNSQKMARMGPVLVESYRKAGIELELEPSEWAVMTKRLVDHDFDSAALLWGSSDSVSDPFQVWHSSQAKGGSNYASFSDPKVDELIDAGRREFDPAKRSSIMRAIGQELYDQQPYLWLTTRPELEAVRRSFRGVKPSVAYYDFTEWWLEPEAPTTLR